jgi:hypothetical protein
LARDPLPIISYFTNGDYRFVNADDAPAQAAPASARI